MLEQPREIEMLCEDLRREERSAQPIPEIAFCEQKLALRREFLLAIRKVAHLQAQQIRAVIDSDPNFEGFDALLHLAQQRKEQAKYAWIAHVEAHHCEEG